jgi:hypothetical protein
MTSALPSSRRVRRRLVVPRWVQVVNLLIFLAAVGVVLLALNFFAMRSEFRAQIDATKTRAYSLSDQTRKMLESLQGDWTIALVVSEASVNPSVRKQMDEVLSRYTQASPKIRVLRIDPDDPRTLRDYEALLRDLQAIYADRIRAYDEALDAGTAAFKELQVFAEQHAGVLVALVEQLPQQEQTRARLSTSAGLISLLAEKGGEVLNAVNDARRVSEARPIADYEGARSILAEALSQWANETDAVAEIFRGWTQRTNLDAGTQQFAANTVTAFEEQSQKLAQAADPLKRLPEMELAAIGRQLATGETAVILGPNRAAVIPSHQLVPKSNLKSTQEGGITFDQRFRGEQLISAAIRSLTLEQMPLVVFVHAEEGSLLQQRERQADLTGAAAMLRSTRYNVQEWIVTKTAERPQPHRSQKAVWVVVPPPPARSVEASPAIRALFEATDKLIADGEPVLLSVSPSLVAKYGQPDPFAVLPQPFGLKPDTGTIVFETTIAPRGESEIKASQEVQDFSDETAIGRAVDGQQAEFGTPVPLRRITAELGGVATVHTIAAIEPSPERWLETDWTGGLTDREPRPDQRFSDPIPIMMAAERANPAGGGSQRFILVGSGGWMLTNVADPVVDVGGGRVALVNPGNHELMLASVAWLAGLDDLIAASPLSQEIARLRGITPEVKMAWSWILWAGVPLGCLLIGMLVYLWRRM